jgi:hypothetical protein
MEDKKQAIYIVTSGDYSEYRICGAFTEEALAEKFIDSFSGDNYSEFRIENYALNPYQYELKNDYKPFFVRMMKEGNCIEIKIRGSSYDFEDEGAAIGFDVNENMYISIFAKDEKHAIKIANEKRVQLIAENRWGRFLK